MKGSWVQVPFSALYTAVNLGFSRIYGFFHDFLYCFCWFYVVLRKMIFGKMAQNGQKRGHVKENTSFHLFYNIFFAYYYTSNNQSLRCPLMPLARYQRKRLTIIHLRKILYKIILINIYHLQFT